MMRVIGLAFLLLLAAPQLVSAETAAELQAQIDANKRQLKALEAEIAEFQKQLDAVGAEKNTLQSTISALTLSQKQLSTQIQITQNKITSANLQIRELSFSISDKEETIAANQVVIAKALRTVAHTEETPLVVSLLSTDSLRDAWELADQAVLFNRALGERISGLRAVRARLSENRDAVAAAKAELVSLQNDLNAQKRSVDANKKAQQQLLAETKNKESNYQRLIAEKQAAGKAFEQQLLDLQGQLDLIVNPNLLPKVGSGVLAWPFDNAFMLNCTKRKNVFGNLFCISQFYGNTAFATKNPQIYSGKGHTGIDIVAPIGTPVRAAFDGTVLDTGNTDLVAGCYSFGKWVMLIHGNGLSTLYSHLSDIDVVKGQFVSAGQVVGLSGMTGYATGPHLHFGVYATQGTQVMTLNQFRGAQGGCARAKMPVAALAAYLNPLSYL